VEHLIWVATTLLACSCFLGLLGHRHSARSVRLGFEDDGETVASRGPQDESKRSLSSHLLKRIAEARSVLQGQVRSELAWRWCAWTLLVVQYIAGIGLASSFVQESLKRDGIGMLGILVVAVSVVRQLFRPETRAVGARSRIARLRYLIRSVEDATVVAVSTGRLAELTLQVSHTLRDVEELEVDDLELISRGRELSHTDLGASPEQSSIKSNVVERLK